MADETRGISREMTEDFIRAEQYTEKNIEQLIKIYGGRFVIVHEERVLDSDLNKFELAKRHKLRYQFDFERTRGYLITKIPATLKEYLEQKSLQPPVCDFEFGAEEPIQNDKKFA